MRSLDERLYLQTPVSQSRTQDALTTSPQSSAYDNFLRAASFWARAAYIYFAYKTTQVRASAARATASAKEVEARVWTPHHTWAGQELFRIAIDLRGFYLKVGQFLGARADFIPEPICRQLSLLQDQVPPMPAAQALAVLQAELGGQSLDEVFAWINLDTPLGSASIAQVHQAQLLRPSTWAGSRRDGLVAVKIQYPDALERMLQDLVNIRIAARFLQATELRFDLVSAVDELAAQLQQEFDFRREAETMDTIRARLRTSMRTVHVPESIAGLVTRRMLVMTFLEGSKITQLAAKGAAMAPMAQRAAARMVLSRVAEAYGRMLLEEGLFQADCHAGNLLVRDDGSIGLLDFGQAKQLARPQRLAFARLLVALAAAGNATLEGVLLRLTPLQQAEVSAALAGLGIRTGPGLESLRVRIAYGMFDTRGRIDPFSADSPLKLIRVEEFPADFFFVLRVVQLLRGIATAMSINDFSVAVQWRPFAEAALQSVAPLRPSAGLRLHNWWPGGWVPGGFATADERWLAGLMAATPLASLWPRGGRLSTAGVRALAAAYLAAGAAASAAMAALRGERTAQAVALALWAASVVAHVAAGRVLLVARLPGNASALAAAAGAAGAVSAVAFSQVHPAAGALMAPYLGVALMATAAALSAYLQSPPSLEPPAAAAAGPASIPVPFAHTAALPATTPAARALALRHWLDAAAVPFDAAPPVEDDPALPHCIWTVAGAIPGRVEAPKIALLGRRRLQSSAPSTTPSYSSPGIFSPLLAALADARIRAHGLRDDGGAFVCVCLTVALGDDIGIQRSTAGAALPARCCAASWRPR
ncbi:hypothetical protein WJX81_008600 [Elliptochloris bilobata]|uniref:Protein kinase domain-containing protein n=1 Tax=Elliptochloris bilobata TaxID=381761 RepID=A0AAW1RKY2_9CHLO